MDHSDSTKTAAWPEEAGHILLPAARTAIERAVKGNFWPSVSLYPEWVNREGACFVTLTQSGKLRGCIGTLVPHRPLITDVKENAVSAAMRDPRFSSLKLDELNKTRIELSLLSPIEPMTIKDKADVLAQLRPHVDGIVLEWRGYRSTFLPQVWEHFNDPEAFLGNLKMKAGLAFDFWAEDLHLSRYTVSKWVEGQEK